MEFCITFFPLSCLAITNAFCGALAWKVWKPLNPYHNTFFFFFFSKVGLWMPWLLCDRHFIFRGYIVILGWNWDIISQFVSWIIMLIMMMKQTTKCSVLALLALVCLLSFIYLNVLVEAHLLLSAVLYSCYWWTEIFFFPGSFHPHGFGDEAYRTMFRLNSL